MSVTSDFIKTAVHVKTNYIIIGLLIAILSAIGFATNVYLKNKITDRTVQIAEMEKEKAIKQRQKAIAFGVGSKW